MKAVYTIFLMAFLILILVFEIFCPVSCEAQFFNPWVPLFSPFYPYSYVNPYPFYPIGFRSLPFLPVVTAPPLMVEPNFRIANAPVTLAIPTVSTTTAPITAILNLLDPAILASNIAVLTTNFPTVFDLLVTTFQLPLI